MMVVCQIDCPVFTIPPLIARSIKFALLAVVPAVIFDSHQIDNHNLKLVHFELRLYSMNSAMIWNQNGQYSQVSRMKSGSSLTTGVFGKGFCRELSRMALRQSPSSSPLLRIEKNKCHPHHPQRKPLLMHNHHFSTS